MKEGFTLAALFGSAAIAALLIATPPEAHASVLCEHRSAAHIAEHGGITEDSRWHIARGELPNCDSESNSDQKASSDQPDDRKSRHCRKAWYC